MKKLKNQAIKLLRDPNLFFEEYFANRRLRARDSSDWRTLAERGLMVGRKARALGGRVRDFFERAPEPVDPTMVLYESFHGRRMSCNPYAIFKYLLEDPRFSTYRHVWVLEQPELYAQRFNALRNVELVKRNSARHRHCLRVAKYLINNNTFAPFFCKREGQVYVNTQHGVPIKTMGKDAKQMFALGANVTRNFLHTDYLVMPNRYTTETMLRSHDVESLYQGQIIETGYPRCDLTRQNEHFRAQARAQLGVAQGKQVLLYAPTYRGAHDAARSRDSMHTRFVNALQERYGHAYVVIYKPHDADRSLNRDVLQDVDHFDTNELLSIVDVLVTDYSSIAFDFLSLRKPILYFAYDLEEYQSERGLYLDLGKLPGVVCREQEDVFAQLDGLADFVETHRAAYDRAIETYCKHEDGRVTQRVVETIFLGRPCTDAYRLPAPSKKKILVYGGNFLNNGITSSVCSFLDAIDREHFDIYVAFDRDAPSHNVARFRARVPADVKVLFYLKAGRGTPSDLARHAASEARRTFGHARFDVAVDANGYGKLWPALMAHVRAEKHHIYLHNCMRSEQRLRPHLADFPALFRLYETRYDRLINVSASSFEENAKLLPHVASKMVCIENIVDANRVRRLAAEPVVDREKINFVNVGRYDHQKGQDRLIRAFAEVHRAHPATRLYLVGHGPEGKALERLVHELGLAGSVILTGEQENPFRFVRECDCFVMSSRYEGQGIALLEALVLGLPCISTDIPGPRSILGREFLFEDSDKGLAEGMLAFIEGRLGRQTFDADAYNARSRAKLRALLSSASSLDDPTNHPGARPSAS